MKEANLIEPVSEIIFEFLNNVLLDVDEVINYWGGETPKEFIFEGEDEEWD